jgi:hypothetical protein
VGKAIDGELHEPGVEVLPLRGIRHRAPLHEVRREVLIDEPTVLLVDLIEYGDDLPIDVLGDPSARAIPRAVTTITPRSPVFTSLVSSVWEWYIHITELPSPCAGPARSGTGHR